MPRIVVSHRIAAPPDAVWIVMSDLPGQVRWMKDIESMTFRSSDRSGVGTVMEVATRIGPFRTNDIMEVVSWEEGRSIGVVHTGVFTGRGALSLTPQGEVTVVTWDENLRFPWWLGGPITGWFAKPVLGLVWSRNLALLAGLVKTG